MAAMRLIEKTLALAAERRIKQRELASMIGVDPSRISVWKRDEGAPSVDQALRIARALGVPLDYLADDAADEPPPALTDTQRRLLSLAAEIGEEDAALILAAHPRVQARVRGPSSPGPARVLAVRDETEADERREQERVRAGRSAVQPQPQHERPEGQRDPRGVK